MQSTKGRASHFIVLSRVDEQGKLGEVQRFEYVEGNQFKTRKAALRHADTARMRWQNNFWQMRDATMTLTDTVDLPLPTPGLKPARPVSRSVSQSAHKPKAETMAVLAPTNDWPAQALDIGNVKL